MKIAVNRALRSARRSCPKPSIPQENLAFFTDASNTQKAVTINNITPDPLKSSGAHCNRIAVLLAATSTLCLQAHGLTFLSQTLLRETSKRLSSVSQPSQHMSVLLLPWGLMVVCQ